MHSTAAISPLIKSRQFYPWIFVVLAVALILRLIFWVGPGQRDDVEYARTAHMILNSEFNPIHGTVFSARTAICFPIAWSWRMFGLGCKTASLYFLGCGLLLVFLGGWLGEKLFGPIEGIIVALLLAFLPIDVVFSTQLMPDLALAAWLALSVSFLVAASIHGTLVLFFISGVALGVAALTKEFSIASLMFLPFFAFFYGKRVQGNCCGVKALICFGTGCSFVLLLQIAYFGNYGEPLKFFHLILSNATSEKNAVADKLFYYRLLFNLHTSAWQNRWFGYFYYGVVLALLWLFFRRRKNTWIPLFWMVAYFIFLQYIGPWITGRQSVEKAERFLIPLGVPASMLIAAALGPLFYRRDIKCYLGGGVLVILLISMVSTTILHAYPVEMLQIARWRNLAYLLERLPSAPIYASGDVRSRIEMYSDFRLNVHFVDFRRKDLRSIKDAWVVVDGDWGGWHDLQDRNILKSWILVAQLEQILKTPRNYLSDYTPKIYWAGMILPSQALIHDRQSALFYTGVREELLLCILKARGYLAACCLPRL